MQAAERAGVVVVIATGRPVRWVHPVAKAVGQTGLAICSNGAVVVDLHNEQVIDTRPFTRSAAAKIVETVRAALPSVTVAVESVCHGFGQEPEYPTHHMDTGLAPRVGPIDEILTDDLVKLLFRHETLGPDDLLAAAKDVAGDQAELTHSSSHGLLEVSAIGVTKATTLAHLAAERAIGADEVVALGDMPNDVPMLTWAGTGYAMTGSHPDVLAATPLRAPSNDDDGVAQIIEELLRESRSAIEVAR